MPRLGMGFGYVWPGLAWYEPDNLPIDIAAGKPGAHSAAGRVLFRTMRRVPVDIFFCSPMLCVQSWNLFQEMLSLLQSSYSQITIKLR